MLHTNVISGFEGEYRWLSNFWIFDPTRNLSVEHYYQAAKTTNEFDYNYIMNSGLTPGRVKKFAKTITIRDDWDSVKLIVMEELTKMKYMQNKELQNKLRETRGSYIIETNYWGDIFWGVCDGVGENHLGKIIMKVRDEFLQYV